MFCPNCGKQNPDKALFCRHCGSRMPETPTETTTAAELTFIEGAAEFVGQNLGRYRVLKQIRQTSTGVVYRALDTQLERIVEIKVLPKAYAADEYRSRSFREEVNLAANLEHANILPIHDFGRVGDNFFVVTKHTEGHSLSRHIEKRAPLAPVEMLRIGIQIASALVYLHKRFIIHGNLSAAGFILDDSGHVVMRDVEFASAKYLHDPGIPLTEDESAEKDQSHLDKRLEAYRAPEVAAGESPDARSDIYSLGSILYHLLTGHLPYTGQEGEAATLSFRGVPLSLEELLVSMLRRDPERRLASAEDVRQGLRQAYSVSITSLAGDEDLSDEFIDFSRLNNAQERDRRDNIEGLVQCLLSDIGVGELGRDEGDRRTLEPIAADEPPSAQSIGRLSFYSSLDEALSLARSGSVGDALEELRAGLSLDEVHTLERTRRFLGRLADQERKLKRARFILGNNLVTEFRRAAEGFSQALSEDPNCEEARQGLSLLGELDRLWMKDKPRPRRRWLKPVLIGAAALAALALALIIFIRPDHGFLADNLNPRGLLPGGGQPLLAGAETAKETLTMDEEPTRGISLAGDFLLVPTEAGELAAYSLKTGDEVWRVTGVRADHPPLVYRGEGGEDNPGQILTSGGSFLELRDHEGGLVTRRDLEAELAAEPRLGPEGHLYVVNERGTVFAFDISTPGRLPRLWATNLGGSAPPVGVYPAPSGRRLFVTFSDGRAVLLDGYNGAQLWPAALNLGGGFNNEHPRPVFDGDLLHLTVDERYVAVDLRDGRIVADLPLAAGPLGNPALSEGSLFFASTNGVIFRLVPGDEPTIYSEELEARLRLERPLICASELLFRRRDNRLTVVNTANLLATPRELPVADEPLLISGGHAFLLSGKTLYRLTPLRP